MPIEALRLSSDTRTTLRRLGFKRIGALIGTPRAPFAARFEQELLKRLDQALGLAPEPLHAVIAPPVYHSARYLLEPVSTIQAVLALAARLMRDLMHALVRDGAGARALGSRSIASMAMSRCSMSALQCRRATSAMSCA